MAVKITNSSQIFTESEVHACLVNKTAQFIKEISAENIQRKDDCSKVINLLNEGIYNPVDYYFLLKSNNQTARLDWLKKNDFAFHGYTSLKNFEMVPEDGFTSAKKVCCFVLKKGVLPSDALHAMRKGLTLMGCGEAVQLAQYLAIEDVLKPEKFNVLFAADSQTPLIIGSRLNNNPISRLRNYFVKEVSPDSSEIKKGDHVYITNATSYLEKHPTGSSQGYNVTCVDDTIGSQKFTTLGLPSEGVTHSQFQDIAISRYNLHYRSMESYSERTKTELCSQLGSNVITTSKKMADAQITSDEFKEQSGGADEDPYAN